VYLGYVIGGGGLNIEPSKMEVMIKWYVGFTKKKLRICVLERIS